MSNGPINGHFGKEVYFETVLGLLVINRIAGKSVHARAFAQERLQYPLSYVEIDMLSRKILKTMYHTISNSTFNDES